MKTWQALLALDLLLIKIHDEKSIGDINVRQTNEELIPIRVSWQRISIS